jgi:3,4-dihydroxy-9,10-secoandrosta-1,3,5(10)-triene-9,17-dione 4,5-dioxygenase
MVAMAYALIKHPSPDEWKEFCLDVLGGVSAGRDEDMVQLRLDERFCRLLVSAEAEDDVAIGWDIGGPERFEQFRDAAEQGGYGPAFLSEREVRQRGVTQGIRLKDPSGQGVEVVWGQALGEPFRSPLGVSAFVSNGGGFGHIVVRSPEVDATVHFYRELFDARVSDVWRRTADALVFLRFSEREHSIALMEGATYGVLHLMVEVATIDDVGYALDRAAGSRWPVKRGLGRHSNDKSLSFYMASPSSFDIEYGCESLLVPIDHVVTQMARGSDWGHRPY